MMLNGSSTGHGISGSRSNSPRINGSSRNADRWPGGRWNVASIATRATPWLWLVVGFGLGHWHGRVLDSTIIVGNAGTRNTFSSSGSSNEIWTGMEPNARTLALEAVSTSPLTSVRSSRVDHDNLEDGWRTIHVFTGGLPHNHLGNPVEHALLSSSSTALSQPSLSTDRRLAIDVANDVDDNPNGSVTAATAPHEWYSQASQDELVWALLRNATHGYFIDLAANDATLLSNTYALERYHGWSGVCIEPNPVYWYNLTAFRRCTVVAAVVGSERMQEVFFRFEAGDHGGIADHGFDNGKRWQASSERRYTVSLLEILRDWARAPTVIDYLSLDVEGAETLVMLNFPLEEYRIKLITAERLHGDIRKYLKSKGYEFVARLSSWGESLWVHDSVRDQLDWSVMDKFHFPVV